MIQGITAVNDVDKDGNPTGGTVRGRGLDIRWQDGPLAVVDTDGNSRREANGCFVETVIAAAKQRLEFFQGSKFNSSFNKDAIYHLEQALLALNARTEDRMVRGVEGTHEI